MSAAPRVLVVDADQTSRQHVVDLLEEEGYEAVAVPDGDTALAMIAPHWWPDLILLDQATVGAGGTGFVPAYHRLAGALAPIILLTDTPGVVAAEFAEELGAVGFLGKPDDGDALKSAVRRHLPPQPARPMAAAQPSDARR
jgi:CheY-like chemotaxis protein